MAEHNELGAKGEEIALMHLKSKGYKIRQTNWVIGKNEIDIIAETEKTIIVVEVKTRSSTYMGEPQVAVNRKKQMALIRAADIYLRRNNLDYEARFDIISIVIKPEGNIIKHIENAFYPTL